jgi:hypothetical protein
MESVRGWEERRCFLWVLDTTISHQPDHTICAGYASEVLQNRSDINQVIQKGVMLFRRPKNEAPWQGSGGTNVTQKRDMCL